MKWTLTHGAYAELQRRADSNGDFLAADRNRSLHGINALLGVGTERTSAFPTDIIVPAAPMRGRIQEVRLPWPRISS